MKPNYQTAIRKILQTAVDEKRETVLQAAAYLDGECIVNECVCADGYDADTRSLLPIFSCGKGVAATLCHILAERGIVDYDAPVAESLWPEFGANGKDAVTLRHILTHTAGLFAMPEHGDADTVAWDTMCRYFENAAPVHAPGTFRAYHAITYSWLVGEPLQRATGKTFAQLLREHICDPLGIDSLFFGLPESEDARTLDAEKKPAQAAPSDNPPAAPAAEGQLNATAPLDAALARAIPHWVTPLEDWINTEKVRRVCIPASNGFANADALARHYAALIGNGIAGKRLLSQETIDAATTWHDAVDGAIPGDGCKGLGYGIAPNNGKPSPFFNHGGYGGTIGVAFPEKRLAVAVLKTRMTDGVVADDVVRTLCDMV